MLLMLLMLLMLRKLTGWILADGADSVAAVFSEADLLGADPGTIGVMCSLRSSEGWDGRVFHHQAGRRSG